ncbi:glycosyl hydrolase [Jiangella asiatica]|uniref:Alpha-L-rhamnosidase n=1 Tax=Jiangella asiatica TaxID=2530372 RepID=A0A4V2Z3V7_9ACTN|nr:glycosyl hydrolase [Jiangella asiatica]TDE14188.1 hypothetical protein E1269_03215 [Jiangella asiatica]
MTERPGRHDVGRRTFLQVIGVATVAAAVGPVLPAGAAPNAAARGAAVPVLRDFATPPRAAGALFRWWWPAAAVDHDVLIDQLRSVADGGYRGVEIGCLYGISDGYPIDPDRFGYGSPAWVEAVERVLAEADTLGLTVDITMGPHWNVSVPGLDVDGPASAKEIVFAHQEIRGGTPYRAPVPRPADRTYVDRTAENGVIISVTRTAELHPIAVQALRTAGGTPAAPVVDLASVVDLTDQVSDGTVDWTPPDAETWVIIGFWYRGSALKPDLPFQNLVPMYSDPEPRCIDYLSTAGTEAFTDYFETILPRRTRQLLRRCGGNFFDDSVEVGYRSKVWTPALLEEFRARRGYALTPYLALLGYSASEATVAQRVKRDVDQTMNDLYIDHHLRPFQRFANSMGMRYQAQPYQTQAGFPVDVAYASALTDVPEGENFGFTPRGSEDWRLIASGADMGGRTIVSDEYRPGAGQGRVPYESTVQDLVGQANGQFALGVNRLRMVGIPYPHVPPSSDGTISDNHTHWPGFHPIGTIPEAMGPRNPTWTMTSDVSGYFARVQHLLQHGVRRTDLAVYTQVFGLLAPGDIFDSAAVVREGYTYGYVSPGTLSLPAATVANRRLAPHGPAYQALIIDNENSMPLEAAEKIDALAGRGLPVIVIGEPPATASGYAETPDQAASMDAALRAVVAHLLSRRNVRRAASSGDVPDILTALGVAPAATSTDPAVRAIRRTDGAAEYHFLHNTSGQPVTTVVSLSGATNTVPYLLDPWTGHITKLATARRRGGRTELEVELRGLAAALVVLGPPTWTAPAAPSRSTTPGSGLPDPLPLPRWDLTVDDWQPARPGQPSSTMHHVRWTFDDIALTPWSEIADIADASGVGTYTTRFTLPSSWRGASGAYLDLGAVAGSYRIRVDGTAVGAVDQLDTRVDIGSHLRPGRTSTIEVEIATNLINRVRVTQAPFAARPRQDYGLLGPVTIVPYLDDPNRS